MTEFFVNNQYLFFPLVAWSLAWKGWALWLSAIARRRNWFIVLLVVNTAGLLEILYIFYFSKRRRERQNQNENQTGTQPGRFY